MNLWEVSNYGTRCKYLICGVVILHFLYVKTLLCDKIALALQHLCINNLISRYLVFLVGYFIPDVIVAAIIGLVTSWSVGPILPVVAHWLARSSILHFLLHSSILALALSSQFFPYSTDAPKRVIFQHTIRNAGNKEVSIHLPWYSGTKIYIYTTLKYELLNLNV